MSNTGNTQQIIDYGATANDGTGDPLRTAFIKTDENFSNIWAAGPVGSNITIANNTIQNDSTNGNIVIKPNGTGVIQANASILPNIDSVRDLGSNTRAWRRAYINIANISEITVQSTLDVAGDAVIQGNLTVEGDTIQIGNITTDTLLIQLANAAANSAQANGAGVTVGANDDIATILYNSSGNVWTTNIGISAGGNVTAPYFLGNGSQLTGISQYGNSNVAAYLPTYTGNLAGSRLAVTSGSNTWVIANDRITSPDGGVWRSDTINNDEYLTSRPDGYINLQSVYANANIASEIHLEHGLVNIRTINGGTKEWDFDEAGNTTFPGNILPGANGVYSLGNSTNYWSNLWVANNTIYIGGVPLGMTAGNVLTVAGEPVLTNDSDTSITTTGNITANVITATGAINVGNMSIGELPGYITADANIGMVVNVSGPDGGFVVDYLKEDGNANTSQGELAFSSETGNATYRISLTDDAGDGFATKIWRFDGTGNLNLPTDGNIIIDGGDGVIGPAGDNLIISWDNENLTLRSIGDDIELQTPYSVRIETGDAGEGEYSGRWDFSSDNGKLNSLPVNPGFGYWNAGHLQFVGNSSGDNNGYTTLRLVPDDTLVGNDQYLIIDPTAPGHIHIRAGGEQDNSAAELIMGGEYSHFKVGSGANATAYISANSHIWWFNQDGTVQVPPSDYGYAQFYTGGGANLYLGSSTYPVNITGADGSIIAPNNITATGNVAGDVGFFNDINLNNAGTNRMLYVDGDRNIYDTDFSYDAGNSSISGSGNITAGYFIGDGSQLTGLPAQYGDSNVATFLAAYGSNTISTSGNVTAGNFLGSGTNVDIIAGSYDWTFDNAGTLTLPGNTFAVNYANGTAVSLGGNYGNANVVANLAALASNPVSTTGNVTAGYFIGNGSQLTGLPASYSNANVATFLASYGSNTISTSGNITAGNFIGNISITGNVTGTSANVDIIAGSYQWTFNNTGNFVLPGNTFAVNYANGTAVTLGGAPGGANTQIQFNDAGSFNGTAGLTFNKTTNALSTTGSVSATGNVTGGNLLTAGAVSATGNITGGNVTTGGLVSATGNVTGGNITTSGAVSATGNVTGGNVTTAGSISATGNVTANTFIGNVSLTGNIQGTSANVELVAGVYTWTFDNTGNTTAPNGIVTFPGAATTGVYALDVGVPAAFLANTITSFTANVNNYTQVTLQNRSAGADATADFILTADNGSDTVNYGDFGIINSGYDPNTPTNSLGNIVYAADTYIYAQGNTSNTAQAGGNLVMGVTTASKNIKLFAGGANTSALIATVSNAGITMNSGNITGNTAGFAIGYRDIPQVSFSANATISTSDAGKHYYSTSASNLVLTIANNASQAFAIGAAINIINRGTGTMTIAQGSGVTLYLAGNTTAGNRTISSYGAATIQKVETDVWFVVGSGLT